MIIFVLFCLTIIGDSLRVSYNKQCDCSKFSTDSSCLEQTDCIWQGNICRARECSEYYNIDKCNRVASCSWNVSQCQKFTKCSDFYMNDSFDCYKIGDQNLNLSCQPSEQGNQCQEFQRQECGNVEEDCASFESQWRMCYWNNNKCNIVDIRYCDQLFNEDLCFIYGEGLGCQWKNGKCTVIQCSDYTFESTCVLQRQNSIEDDPLLCRWTGIKCEEAQDVSHLDFSNCLVNSFYNYIWDSANNQCVSCQTYIPPTSESTP
ncbi:unnamed protein product (macronuclear) [Paramecium tetraurelia]|uniref:Mini antigen n=1 Tax=Paramecium tetraurelia TaxID=5888 RepID=A0DUA8_PARTE|nr:uncharacterized protein GSPATT00020297001 [Paramecium tetraurelia]CAK86625.1 unnamed protein product [Paramecium tetraurelia]|eukprot:XP_001454022.1 hypothetical protein (macronuclear) [Paramecium tetraurelia strain d4-2]